MQQRNVPVASVTPVRALEDAYGTHKRLRFIDTVMIEQRPQRVLDVGCGTGAVASALASCNPGIQILGIDSDSVSIEFARRNNPLPNVTFMTSERLAADETFDLIIASEVLEHVEAPEAFLLWLRSRLRDRGKIVVTVPNGYGPFEIMSFIETIVRLVGLHALLRRIWRALRAIDRSDVPPPDSLAVSPHINFFSFETLCRLFSRSGLMLRRYQPRTFLCGFVLDNCLRGRRLIEWNAAVADRLPTMLSSDWMFVLEKAEPDRSVILRPPGIYGRLRRHLNMMLAGRQSVG